MRIDTSSCASFNYFSLALIDYRIDKDIIYYRKSRDYLATIPIFSSPISLKRLAQLQIQGITPYVEFGKYWDCGHVSSSVVGDAIVPDTSGRDLCCLKDLRLRWQQCCYQPPCGPSNTTAPLPPPTPPLPTPTSPRQPFPRQTQSRPSATQYRRSAQRAAWLRLLRSPPSLPFFTSAGGAPKQRRAARKNRYRGSFQAVAPFTIPGKR